MGGSGVQGHWAKQLESECEILMILTWTYLCLLQDLQHIQGLAEFKGPPNTSKTHSPSGETLKTQSRQVKNPYTWVNNLPDAPGYLKFCPTSTKPLECWGVQRHFPMLFGSILFSCITVPTKKRQASHLPILPPAPPMQVTLSKNT